MRLDIGVRALVDRAYASEVLGLERREAHRQIMAQLQIGVATKIGQALAFFLGHMIAIGLVAGVERLEPRVGADLLLVDGSTRIADLVMILDRILRFVLGAVGI